VLEGHREPMGRRSGEAGAGDQRDRAIEAEAPWSFNRTFSVMVECENQAEIDRLWDGLSDGGEIEQCGWLRDSWGLCWLIAPKRLGELMMVPDRAKVKRVSDAMLQMVKLDIAGLEAAAKGGMHKR